MARSSKIHCMNIEYGPELVDVTPGPEYDYQYRCLNCGTVFYTFAFEGQPELRGAPIPQDKPRARGTTYYDPDWEAYFTVIVCPECRSEEWERRREAGPFPEESVYETFGPETVRGFICFYGCLEPLTGQEVVLSDLDESLPPTRVIVTETAYKVSGTTPLTEYSFTG